MLYAQLARVEFKTLRYFFNLLEHRQENEMIISPMLVHELEHLQMVRAKVN